MSAQIEPLLTIADLEAMPDDGNRYELFAGEIIVSRSPSLSHQRILGNLFVLLRAYLEQHPVGEIVLTPGVIFDEFNGLIPDAIFMSDGRSGEIISGERLVGAPELAIEIVSPGKENARRDRELKREIYGKFGVEEYWIVDPVACSLEIYRLAGRTLKLVETLRDEDEITTSILPGFVCQAHQLFGK